MFLHFTPVQSTFPSLISFYFSISSYLTAFLTFLQHISLTSTPFPHFFLQFILFNSSYMILLMILFFLILQYIPFVYIPLHLLQSLQSFHLSSSLYFIFNLFNLSTIFLLFLSLLLFITFSLPRVAYFVSFSFNILTYSKSFSIMRIRS